MDEAHVALRIVGPRFWQSIGKGTYVQTMPVGLAALQRLAISAFGPSERAFRLIPLCASIGSLILFHRVARRLLVPWAAATALALIAFAMPLVAYASEAKQYSSDVFITLLLTYLWLRANSKFFSESAVTTLAAAGAASVWFCHPAVFVLAGIGLGFVVAAIQTNDRWRFWSGVICGVIWLASFGLYYRFSLIHVINASVLDATSHRDAFAPAAAGAVGIFEWLEGIAFKLFGVPLGRIGTRGASAALLIGAAYLLKRRPVDFVAMLGALFVTGFAAYIHRYPLHSRLLLFLMPLFAVTAAEGIRVAVAGLVRGFHVARLPHARLVSGIFSAAVVGLILYHPVAQASRTLSIEKRHEDVRSAVNFIRQDSERGDLVYVYWGAADVFDFYNQLDPLDVETVRGTMRRDPERYHLDIDPHLRGHKRLWVVFAHSTPEDESAIKDYLGSIGKEVSNYRFPGAFALLYELNPAAWGQ